MLAVFLPNQADADRQQPFAFQVVAERADGARAVRSDRREKHRIDPVLFQQARDLRSAFFISLG